MILFNWLRERRVQRWNARQGWRFIGAAYQGQQLPEWPVDIWQSHWHRAGSAHLREPLYGEQRLVPIYRIETGGNIYDFASTEFSNGVFGFYLPR